jgi:RNA polymerase sigma-32 factor
MSRVREPSEQRFRSYIANVDRLPILSRELELELARRYREEADQDAANQLIEAHLRSVVKMARKYAGYGIPVSELVAEGNLGLIEAARRFEPERQLRFFTYARYWIRAYILAYVLRQWSIVDMGTSALQSKIFFRLQAEKARLDAELGDDARVDTTLADRFHTSEDHVRASLFRLRGRDTSLDAPLVTDGRTTFLDVLPDEAESQEQRASQAEMSHLVREAVANLWPRLDDRERQIVHERLLPEDDDSAASLAQLGRRMGVTRERVRQIEVALKAKLRCEFKTLSGELTPDRPCGQPCPCAA